MPDPTSLGYIGAVTGILGTITGAAGLGLGYISYRRSEDLKALDLRLELRKMESDLRVGVQELPDLLERSRQSRVAVSVARGLGSSGALEGFKAAWQLDVATVKAMAGEVGVGDKDYRDTTHRDLESKLVEAHAFASRVARMREKYLGELATDDREREQLRADMRVHTQAWLGNKQ